MFSVQDVLNLMIGIGSIAAPIVYKVLANQIKDAKDAGSQVGQEAKNIALEFARSLNEFKLHVADHYVKNSRLEQMEERVMGALTRIEQKLDGKQDKP